MSIVHTNTDLRETHIIGGETREWLISAALFPALVAHGILLAGLTDAGAGFHFMRPAPRWKQILACTSGQGWVLLDGQWVGCEAGTAYLTPAGTPHAYQADSETRWGLCWVQSSDDWLRRSDETSLLTVEPGPMAAALTGLRREATDTADPVLLLPWAFLAAAYARRMVRPQIGDPRLRRLWETVGSDLGRLWNVETLAALVGVSGEHLRRLCHQHFGRSPMSHVAALRMRQAMALLASESYTIEAVAQQVGYDSPFAFSAAFKRHQGVSPSEYRQRAHGR